MFYAYSFSNFSRVSIGCKGCVRAFEGAADGNGLQYN